MTACGGAPRAAMGAGVPDLRPLVGVAAAVTVLAAAGAVPAWPGLAHHVALPPLDLFADVRVLLAEAPSYPSFVSGLVASLVLRSVVLAAMLGALGRQGMARGLAFYGASLVPALVAGVLGFSGVVVLYALFLWAAVVVAVAAVVVLGPLPWRGWRCSGARQVVVAYLVALLAVSLASSAGARPAQVGLVWVSAGLTAVAVRRLSGEGGWLRGGWLRGGWRPVPSAILAVVLAAGPVQAPAQSHAPAAEPAAGVPPRPRDGTLFLVPGIGASSGTSTMFRLDPGALGFGCEQTVYFSYAGPGDGAPRRSSLCPITRGAPYVAEDTHRPMAELAASFRAQLADLTPPVVVVAHSQGGWIVASALGGGPAGAVDAVVLLGTFPRHQRGYVLDGTGGGLVGSDGMEVLTGVLRAAGATSFDPRAPLPRDHLGTTGAVADLMAGGFPGGVRVVTVTAAPDLPLMGADWRLDDATDLCPVYVDHSGLITSSRVHRLVGDALDGRDPAGCAWWRRWPPLAFAAFGAPSP
ncbi:MAG TPA: hypothetical protein VFZ79_21100 [Acidimicrobiales bacterium]